MNSLRNDMRRVESAFNQERRNLADNRSRLDRRRFELESEVNEKYQALQRAVSDLDARLSEVRSDIRALDRTISDINGNLIPRQRDVISDARSAIVSLQPRLREARANLSQVQAELNEQKIKTGYDKKRADYVMADARVKELRTLTANLDLEIKQVDASIVTQNKALAKIQTEVDDLVAKLAKETAGLDEIEAVLNPLREQKATHVAALETAQAKLATEMADYRMIYGNTFAESSLLRISVPTQFYDWYF